MACSNIMVGKYIMAHYIIWYVIDCRTQYVIVQF